MRKQLYFFIATFIIVFVAISTQAQLIISSNTTWSTDQILTQSVIVNPGVTLTIEQGVKVEAVFVDVNTDTYGDIYIDVQGKLVTKGTQCDPVVFRPFPPVQDSSKHWKGIFINSTMNNDSLHFFTLEHADSALWIESQATVKGVNIYDCPVPIQIDSTASVTVEESFIHDSYGSGIVNYGGTLTLNNSHIYDNPKFGIATMGGVFVMGFCDVDSNQWGGIYIGGANADIQNCEIKANGGSGIEITEWAFDSDFNSLGYYHNLPTIHVVNNNIFTNAATTHELTEAQTTGTIVNIPGICSCLSQCGCTGCGYANYPEWEIPFGRLAWMNTHIITGTQPPTNILRNAYTNVNEASVTGSGWLGNCGNPYNINDWPGQYGPTDRYYFRANRRRAIWNIKARIKVGGYEVYSAVAADTTMEFENNYWGQITGVDTLLLNVDTGNIDYSPYLTSEIQNIGTSIGSGLPVVALGVDTTICDSTVLTLDAGNNGATYNWSTTETTQTIDVENSPGTYYVTVTNGCGSNVDSITISADPWPLTPNTPTGQTLLCQDYQDNPYITSGATYATSYLWSVTPTTAGVISGTGTTGTMDWSSSFVGVATIHVQGVNSCGTGPGDSVQVTVTATPTVTISGDTTVCDGNGTTLTASGGTAYSWSSGGTTASEFVNPTSTTTYSVTVTDGNSCTNVKQVTVLVGTAPTATALVTDADCFGNSTGSIDLSPSGNSPFSFDWSNTETTEDISGLAAGTYTVTITDDDGCTAVVTETVGEPGGMTGTVSSDDDTGNCDGEATVIPSGGAPPYTYLWDALTGSQTTITATGLCANTYCVTVTDDEGCTWDTCVSVAVGVGNHQIQGFKVVIWPNPNDGKFTVEASSAKHHIEGIKVVDVFGREVVSFQLANTRYEIDLTKEPAGVYLLQVATENGTLVRKVVLE